MKYWVYSTIAGHNTGCTRKACQETSIHPCVLPYFRQLLDLIGIEVEFLQGLLEAKDLLRNSLQAAVGVVQRRYRLLLTPQAAARHQPNKQAPLGHPQALEEEKQRYVEGVG